MVSVAAMASANSAVAFARVRAEHGARRPRAIPRARPGAPKLIRTTRPSISGAPSRGTKALGDDSYHNIPADRLEPAAEEAMKYAVDKWLELDRVQQAQSQKIREMQERELEEVRRAAREAVEKVSSTSEAMRTAESNAKLWEARAREVRADLEFTQQQLQDVQSEMARISSSGSGSSYGHHPMGHHRQTIPGGSKRNEPPPFKRRRKPSTACARARSAPTPSCNRRRTSWSRLSGWRPTPLATAALESRISKRASRCCRRGSRRRRSSCSVRART